VARCRTPAEQSGGQWFARGVTQLCIADPTAVALPPPAERKYKIEPGCEFTPGFRHMTWTECVEYVATHNSSETISVDHPNWYYADQDEVSLSGNRGGGWDKPPGCYMSTSWRLAGKVRYQHEALDPMKGPAYAHSRQYHWVRTRERWATICVADPMGSARMAMSSPDDFGHYPSQATAEFVASR
jgi:hypothetical protein